MPEALSEISANAGKDPHSQMRVEMEPTPPPPVVRTPLFVWHLAVWSPTEIAVSEEIAAQNEENRFRRIDLAIDDLLYRLMIKPGVCEIETDFWDGREFRLFGGPASRLTVARTSPASLADFPFSGDGHEQVRTICFTWFGLKITLRFEVQAEIVMMTSYIDASSFPATPPEAPEPIRYSLDMLRSGLLELNALLCRNETDSLKYRKVFKDLYKAPAMTVLLHILEMSWDDVRQFGSDFADFRGLVISSPAEPGTAGVERFFALPGETPIPHDGESPSPPPLPLSHKKWHAKLRVLWPFLMTPPTETANPKQHELTVSRLLGGRVLLATSLALDLQESETSPLHYFIYTNGTSPWETGRMLNTLAHTGTFRLAALMNMGKMRQVPPRLTICETSSELRSTHFPRNSTTVSKRGPTTTRGGPVTQRSVPLFWRNACRRSAQASMR